MPIGWPKWKPTKPKCFLSAANRNQERGRRFLKYTQILILQGNLNAISDAGSAAALAGAAISGAALNVRINALGLKDKQDSDVLIKEISKVEMQAKELQDQILSQVYQRGGLNPE